MFSIVDCLPTFARVVGARMPTDRQIDGVDQTDVLLGNSAMGHRESLLSFVGGDPVAARWKQWRIYFTVFIRQESARSASPASSRPAFPWLGTRSSTISRWTPTRILSSEDCLVGCQVPRSRSSKSTWRRSRSIQTRLRPTLNDLAVAVVSLVSLVRALGETPIRRKTGLLVVQWHSQFSSHTCARYPGAPRSANARLLSGRWLGDFRQLQAGR